MHASQVGGMKMSVRVWNALLLAMAVLVAAGCTEPKAEEPHSGTRSSEQAAPNTGSSIATKRRVFVSNYKTDTLSVVEGQPEMEAKVLPAGASPHGLDIRPTEPRLLAVANSTDFGVTLFDPDTLEKKGAIETSRGPQDLVFSKDGKRLLVISPLEWTLHTIDVDEMKVVGEPFKFKNKPRRILLSPDGKKLYVLMVVGGDGTGANVTVMDSESFEIEKEVEVGRHPQDMALGNNGKTLVTASFDDSMLSVIDTDTLETTGRVPAGTGMGLAVHQSKPIAYSMVSFDDEIQVVDLESGKTLKTFSGGSWPTYPSFDKSGRYLYIPHEESANVVKLDTETNEIVAKIAVGDEPIEVVVYEP